LLSLYTHVFKALSDKLQQLKYSDRLPVEQANRLQKAGIKGMTAENTEQNKKREYFYLEDFTPGRVFKAGPLTVTAAEIKAYAALYDPQYFHLDEEAAKDSVFGRLVASGWHTAALSMRLFVSACPDVYGGMIGRTIENINWPRPVYPEDALSIEAEVKEVIPSKSKPHLGVVKMRNRTLNQHGEPVQIYDVVMFVPKKISAAE